MKLKRLIKGETWYNIYIWPTKIIKNLMASKDYGGPQISDHFSNFAVDKLSANLTF
jgi:hypothetical protein